IALAPPDGSARQVADGVAFPNGMVVTPDNATLILAESYGKKLTAFDIAADGGLSHPPAGGGLRGGVAAAPRPSTSRLTAASRTGGCGPTSTAASPTASASTPQTPSGTGMSQTSVACV